MNNSLFRIWAVAANSFLESVRTKAFLVMMAASLGLILSSLLVAQLAVVGQEKRVVQDFGLFFISLMGVVLAVTSGVILVFKELDKKTIFTVLARPLYRSEFILGKYLGLMVILLLQLVLLGAIWFLVMSFSGISPQLIFVKALLLAFCEWAIITAVALLFSSFSTPVLSGLLTIAIFMVGRVVYLVQEMLAAKSRGLFVSVPALRPFGELVVSVFPDLSVFNIGREILLNLPVTWGFVAQAALYAGCFVVVLVTLAALLFSRRDFV
jgi:ABC-type transport system involved in multi-copper enzyme maturation permease subunit